MKLLRSPASMLAATMFLVVAATPALPAQVSIDFNNGTQNQPVDGTYASLGVAFSNTQWQNALLPPFDGIDDHIGASLPYVITAINTPTGYSTVIPESHALVMVFDPPVASISLNAMDVGCRGAALRAYDAVSGGGLVAEHTILGTGYGTGNFVTLSVTAPVIVRVEAFQPLGSLACGADGTLFDDLVFTPLPGASVVAGASSCGGIGNGPALSATSPVLGQPLTIQLASATPLASGSLYASAGGASALQIGGGCEVGVDPSLALPFLPITTDAAGSWSLSVSLPADPAIAGLSTTFQAFLAPTAGPLGFDLSNWMTVTLGY